MEFRVDISPLALADAENEVNIYRIRHTAQQYLTKDDVELWE
ncbi:hypothetical protein [Nostoc piscinale]